jgi:hypothetical protein
VPAPSAPTRSAPARAQTAPVAPPLPPPLPPPPPGPTPLAALDDDILGGHESEEAHLMTPPPMTPERAAASGLAVTTVPGNLGAESGSAVVRQQSTPEGEETYFRQVYDDFIELKRSCGENTDSLTFDKFLVKLTHNREQLMAKYACKAVRFQVYVKDGKAALKATPIKG